MINIIADLEKLGQKIWSEFKSHQAAMSAILSNAAKVASTAAAALAAAGEAPAIATELGNVANGLVATETALGQESSATSLIQGVSALTGLGANLLVTTNIAGVKSDASKAAIGAVLSEINKSVAVVNNALVATAATTAIS